MDRFVNGVITVIVVYRLIEADRPGHVTRRGPVSQHEPGFNSRFRRFLFVSTFLASLTKVGSALVCLAVASGLGNGRVTAQCLVALLGSVEIGIVWGCAAAGDHTASDELQRYSLGLDLISGSV